jgi:MFS family permease
MSVLLLIFFLGTSDNQMISPLLPRIAEDFGYGANVGEVGRLLYPAYALAAAAAALLIGPLSDKYGRRRFLLYAAVVFGLSLLAAALIHNLYLLAAVRMITGVAAGTFSTCSIAYVADYFPYERRGAGQSGGELEELAVEFHPVRLRLAVRLRAGGGLAAGRQTDHGRGEPVETHGAALR